MYVVLLCLSLNGTSAATAQEQASELYLLKAAFIYNFAKLTHWPEELLSASSTPLRLCTVGDDPLIDALVQLGGTTVQGHRVTIRRLGNASETGECQLLYLATSERHHSAEIIDRLRGQPVLTISEIGGFGVSEGIIGLYRDGERIRFRINLEAAHQVGLRFSSRLLEVAVIVGGESRP